MADRTALISVEEYFAITEKPYFEYLDGVLRQKAWPTYDHGKMQIRLCNLIDQARLGLEALPELTLKVSERIYLIPDVAVVRVSEIEEPYPTKPVFLCIESCRPTTASAIPSPNARNTMPGASPSAGSSIPTASNAGNITRVTALIRYWTMAV
jgi:Uma2 family endonuclease